MKIERYSLAGLRCVEVAPDNSNDKTDLPVVITLHGLGDWGESYTDFPPMLSKDKYRFVFPTAPIPLPGAQFQWFQFDPNSFFENISKARQYITQLLDALIDRYNITAKRIVLSGFSQGAMLTFDAGLRYLDKNENQLAGLIALSGMLVVESKIVPNFMSPDFKSYYANVTSDVTALLEKAAKAQVPIMVAHGSRDMVVPIGADRESVALLKKAGLPVEYHEFNYGHEINYETIVAMREFLGKVLK